MQHRESDAQGIPVAVPVEMAAMAEMTVEGVEMAALVEVAEMTAEMAAGAAMVGYSGVNCAAM